MYNRNLHDCIDISIPALLSFGYLCNWKHVNHRDDYGLEIPANLQPLHFHAPEKATKLAKK